MTQQLQKRRGRPPTKVRENTDTKALLINVGLAVLTEKGFSATGIDAILKQANVPKGSFYHYFKSKSDFGLTLINAYDDYFQSKIKKHLNNDTLSPLERVVNFANDAKAGMAKYDYQRGCLIGNLNQELSHLDNTLKQQINSAYESWQQLLKQCLIAGQQCGQVNKAIDTEQLAEFFWIGWEGAVMRSKLTQSDQPMTLFTAQFLKLVVAH